MSAGLSQINLVVWSKTNAGMGSLYRSQYELHPLFKKGDSPHVNNVALGKMGRWRSNVWTYPGASTIGSDARQGLKHHPTVKPVTMLRDALLDLTHRGDIVLDPFLGSGSTLIAAEKTGRVCRGIELNPLYVDVVARRYQEATGRPAILEETGESFSAVAKRRSSEMPPPSDVSRPVGAATQGPLCLWPRHLHRLRMPHCPPRLSASEQEDRIERNQFARRKSRHGSSDRGFGMAEKLRRRRDVHQPSRPDSRRARMIPPAMTKPCL